MDKKGAANMPFESEAERRFMFAKHPKIAEEFAKSTPKGADLPEHVKSSETMAEGGIVDEKDGGTPPIKPIENVGDATNTLTAHAPSYLQKFLDIAKNMPV